MNAITYLIKRIKERQQYNNCYEATELKGIASQGMCPSREDADKQVCYKCPYYILN